MDRVALYDQTCQLSLLSLKASLQQTSSQAPEFYAVSILSLLLCAHSAAQGVSVAALPLPACRLSEHSHAAKYNLLQMRMYCCFFFLSNVLIKLRRP